MLTVKNKSTNRTRPKLNFFRHPSLEIVNQHRPKVMISDSNRKISVFMYIIIIPLILQLHYNICCGFKNNGEKSCNHTRTVLTETWGQITDGPGDYPKESHCEWLIRGAAEHYIVLNITVMDTECSYDHLYVYDGETYDSSLLAVFSGKSSPSPVVAKSGAMLILLYSDTNYMRSGFHADYYITACPLNCSGRGQCLDHTCICSDRYSGSGCETELCPEDCGFSEGRGMCNDEVPEEIPSCLCSEGYTGDGCSLHTESLKGDSWHWIHRDGDIFTPRTSHSTIYIPPLDKLYIFGGYNLNDVLDDLLVYSFKDGTWVNLKNESPHRSSFVRRHGMNSHRRTEVLPPLQTFFELHDGEIWQRVKNDLPLPNLSFSVNDNHTVILKPRSTIFIAGNHRYPRMIQPSEELKQTVIWPSARFGHCSERFQSHFVFYGGKLNGGNVSAELWLFNTTAQFWTLLSKPDAQDMNDIDSPPSLIYCSLTLVDEEWLYLFGGSLQHGEFSNIMYRISPQRGWIWEKVETYGGNPLNARVVGHTTVYYEATRSLYIYGGIRVNIARFSKLSDQLLVFNIDKHFWSEIHYPKGSGDSQYFPAPLERAFHTSLIAGNYMVVFGGYMHKHKEEEACYDHKIYLFHLGCHVWLSPELIPSQEKGHLPKVEGIYGHAAVLRHGNTLIITGGFRGTVTNHVLAYILPSTIIVAEGHTFNRDEACKEHDSQSSCVSNMECGWCATDNTCYDRSRSANCTTNLQTSTCRGLCPTLYTCQSCVVQGGGNFCGWCIKSRTCQSLDPGLTVQRNCVGLHHQQGWWSDREQLLTTLEGCSAKDIPPGLTFLQYRTPVNYSQPDSVSIISDLGTDLHKTGDPREPQELQTGSFSEFQLRGFLHPLYMEYMSLNKLYQGMEPVRLFLEGYKLNASLWLSSDDSSDNLQEVASLVMGKRFRTEATTNDGEPLISDISKKYLLQLDIVPLQIGTNSSLNLSLSWSLGSGYQNPLTVQHLEPFGEGGSSCFNHSSCLACLSDSLCGWCSSARYCIPRNYSTCSVSHFLVIDSSQCEQCEDFIYCSHCIDTGYCEWIPEKAHCTRKGRYPKSVQDVQSCPVPCHKRPTCTACLGEPGLCAWCEATQECFLFSLYTSVYQYGACRIWLDEDHTNVTAIQHSARVYESYNRNFNVKIGNTSDSINRQPPDYGECLVCERFSSCTECLESLGCGWCFNEFNPTVGRCTSGDFSRPHKGTCDALMQDVLDAAEKNGSLVFDPEIRKTKWTYASCPDVDECLLQLHDCHPNATCINTLGGFNCSCPRGFKGNGRVTCERTCYESCVNGVCSGSPDYKCICNLGWTGTDCSINCGCNNHSTCQRVGVCDHCQEETIGDSCQFCRPGSYGNATTVGCKRCDCNGHWDESEGKCDQTTGQCFCVHNTYGHTCDKCLPEFYGDPRNNGRCYRKCTARGIITNATQGYFGSQTVGAEASDTCLWILSAHSTINPPPHLLQGSHILQVTIEDIEIDCQEGALYIYEGLPDFVSVRPVWDKQNLAGTYCNGHSSYPVTSQALSGIMTVFYEKRSLGQGFRASYEVLHCPDNPGMNRNCLIGKPVCNEGWRGIRCEVAVCQNRCFESDGKGRCDVTYGRCICNPGYVGEDCSIDHQEHLVVLQELFNPLKISSSLSHLQTVLPRFGHSLVVDHQGSLWVFGGYSLSRGPLNDIQQFDTRNKTWVQVTVNVHPGAQPPSQRYFHASAYVVRYNEMFVYGGMNKTHFLRDFWKFNIATESWALLPVIENLPGLSGHTLTYKGDASSQSLVLIGGVSAEYGLLDDIWEFDLLRFTWQKVVSNGAKPTGVFGHSTVYHEPTQSFYVYGGYVYQRKSLELSARLFVFDYEGKRWSVLPPDGKINHNPASRPAPRAFHSAVTTEEYMVLIGGYIYDRLNSNQDLMVYSYNCNMWIPLNNHFITVAGYQLSPPMIGVSVSRYESSIYLIGGFAGMVYGFVIEITIPEDLCTLNANKTQCRDVIGCANCVVYQSSGTNTSYCYSNTKAEPSSCLRPHGKLTSIKGIQCDAALLEDRECYQYKTCTECLASWPAHKDLKQKCQWCLTCPQGKCIPKQGNCLEETTCLSSTYQNGDPQAADINKCPTLRCAASDCEKCLEIGHCSWVQLKAESSAQQSPHTKLAAEKVCTSLSVHNHSSSEPEWISQSVCPKRCHFHRTCKACLESDSSEGGSVSCHWSPTLRKCLSPISIPLQCLGGTCGHLLKQRDQCPAPCTSYIRCSECLAQAQCGWCAVDTKIGGLGICSEGRLDGPWRGRCRDLHYEVIAKNQTLMALHSLNSTTFVNEITAATRDVHWHYGNCPPENECENRHHTCNIVKETCEDTLESFTCKCASGYNMSDEGVCQPVCNQGCEFGSCVKPNTCSCHFGFVGINCSIKCQCNGHSECAGPSKLSTCLKCHNNTVGPQCQRCELNYVGNPEKNERCKSCQEYCYEHTNLCTSKEVVSSLNISMNGDSYDIEEINSHLGEEPLTDAVCLRCNNNTEGPRCNNCLPGYFRGTTNRSAPCRPCQCNGHGSTCDREWGSNCDCKNNTETPCNDRMRGGIPGKEKDKDCWKRQCSKCKEAYFGNPTKGHQCYRQMTLETEYCLDPYTQNDCHSSPSPLPKGQAMFFAVQPKFNNVDIRLFLDISKGGIDVYFATYAEGYVVTVNESNWYHQVDLDPAYPVKENNPSTSKFVLSETPKLLSPRYDLIGASSYLTKINAEHLLTNRTGNSRVAPQFILHNVNADGLKTYFTLYNSNHFLLVKNLTDRLVITLPKQNHNLSEAKFYVVLFGVGDSLDTDSYGAIYFRQDQPRIDLFVFFSVFFSCFFLFLAVCVVVWKIKQGVDQRRARRRHVVEMLHMAKRPFSSTTLVLSMTEATSKTSHMEVTPDQVVWSPARRKRGQKRERAFDKFDIGPVAVEPTDDGVAAVVTVMVQMPGFCIGGGSLQIPGDIPPQRLALGSSLCLVSRIYPPTSRPFHLRRRASHLSA